MPCLSNSPPFIKPPSRNEVKRLTACATRGRDIPLRLRSLCAEPDRSPEASLPLVPTRKKRITTLQELLLTYPEIAEVLLDATEQSVPQPEDKQKRKLAYSGEQHDHTVKTQIVATRKTILHVFGGLPGCLKKWGCMAGVWRGKFADHEGGFCVVAGLLNFRHTGKFELFG